MQKQIQKAKEEEIKLQSQFWAKAIELQTLFKRSKLIFQINQKEKQD